jgi:hypothetical protein
MEIGPRSQRICIDETPIASSSSKNPHAAKIPALEVRRMMRKITVSLGILALAVLIDAQISAFADDPPPPDTHKYYVSMRALSATSSVDVASYVTVTREQDATHATAIAGCDERTYYATAADAAAITTARSAGEVVQLHRGAASGTPQASAIMCVIDGQGAT